MLNLALIMGFIGMAVGLIIGVLIFSSVEDSIDCPDVGTNPDGNAACTKATGLAWTVIGILPISLFTAISALFGGMNNLVFR